VTGLIERYRTLLYLGGNGAFLTLLVGAQAMQGSGDPRIAYLVLLFALCSSPLLSFRRLNDEYALLDIFMAVYFTFYGATDLIGLLVGMADGRSSGFLTLPEFAILLGAGLLLIGYRGALALAPASATQPTIIRDWSRTTVILAGLALWIIGTYAMWIWNVYIVNDTTIEATARGLAKLTPLETSAFILAQLLQPLGLLVLAYAHTRYRERWLLLLVIGVVAIQVVIGFVIDVKATAMLGGILVIVTKVLIDGRLPKAWLAAAALFVVFAFPVFQAFRVEVRGNQGIAREDVVKNIGRAFSIAFAAKDRVNTGSERSQTFFERASLKASVAIIIDKTGDGVVYQNGETLSPILATFVPRILWEGKPAVPTGQIMNREFHISEVADTYISPSHLGELYWNFGWAGVVIGMTLIGFAAGFVGARTNLSHSVSVTRLLVAVITIRQVVIGFEGNISVAYVLWFRSLAAIGLMHWILARRTAAPEDRSAHESSLDAAPALRFGNLLR
jgi:hypothetical protein